MNGIVQAKMIGGFGNQLFQYTSVRKYAEIVGAKLEVSDWVGSAVFGLSDPRWSKDLPEVNDGGSGGPPAVQWGQTDIRLTGYFQMQRWAGLLSRRDLKGWLCIRPELLAACIDRSLPGRYTAAHVRQGDYIGHPLYANVTEKSYREAAEKHGLPIDVWIRQDQYRKVRGLDGKFHFLPDFVTLMRAATLFRANSSFSWWASVLGDGAPEDTLAPVVEDRVGECDAEFVRGNWPRFADRNRVGIQIDDLHLPD